MGALWKYLRSSLSSVKDPYEEEIFLRVVLETARLVRNMVAGVPENQAKAMCGLFLDDFCAVLMNSHQVYQRMISAELLTGYHHITTASILDVSP